jgi:hypothetical protein
MADEQNRDDVPSPNPAVSNPRTGSTHEADFGRTDRYTTKDDERNVRNLGDGSDWDHGREASIGHGTHSETDMRSADAETPGVQTGEPEDEDT